MRLVNITIRYGLWCCPAIVTPALLKTCESKIDDILLILISIVVGVIILATIGAMIVSGFIAKPVKNAASGLENISSGDADLTRRLPVPAKGETGQMCLYFNTFLEKLQKVINSLKKLLHRCKQCSPVYLRANRQQQGKDLSFKELSQTIYRSAGYMADNVNSVTQQVEEVDGAMSSIISTLESLKEMVYQSAQLTNQFRA